MTTARYSQPCQVRMEVISVTLALPGRVSVNRRYMMFGIRIDGLDLDTLFRAIAV